jgi:hypothetical protein
MKMKRITDLFNVFTLLALISTGSLVLAIKSYGQSQNQSLYSLYLPLVLKSSGVPTQTPTPTLTPTPTPAQCPSWFLPEVWTGEYWNNENLSGNRALCRWDSAIDFDWLDGSPHPSIAVDHFSARWTRDVFFTAGIYQFNMEHDDGARLFIDNDEVYGNWCDGCIVARSLRIVLREGFHPIKYEMHENTGWSKAKL